jgi:hypothetical protein
MSDDSRWRGIRWRPLEASGQLWSTNLRGAFVDLVAQSVTQAAAIYDSFSTPQNLITRLVAAPGQRDYWPRKDVTFQAERGVYVSFSTTALTGTVTLGWFPSGKGER